MLVVALLMHGNSLFHAGLLGMPLLCVNLGFQSSNFLCKLRTLMHFACFLFAFPLMVIELLPVTFPMQLNVLPLRHCCL